MARITETGCTINLYKNNGNGKYEVEVTSYERLSNHKVNVVLTTISFKTKQQAKKEMAKYKF